MLKINFVDFWPNFKKEDNYFFHLLNSKYDVRIDENDPDLLFFSVDYAKRDERARYNNHRCKKIFFTGENVSPNFDGPLSIEYPRYSIGKADAALSFDYSDDPRNYRFPLWAFFINWFEVDFDRERDPSYLIPLDDVCSPYPIGCPTKSEFCNFLFANVSGKRLDILSLIEQYKPVVCPGKLRHNTTYQIRGRGDQTEKIDFISRFRFTIAAENSKRDGYTTEKLIHPFSVKSIPIYWGSDRVTEEFNEKAFINANKLSGEDLVDRVMEIDQNLSLYRNMINEPVFPNNILPDSVWPKNVLEFLERMVL